MVPGPRSGGYRRSMPETEPTCRICRARPERVRRFHAKGKEEIFLYRCGNCGSEMLLPQPSDALIRAQYRDYYCRRTLLTDAPFPKQAFFNELISGNMELFPAKRFRAVEL